MSHSSAAPSGSSADGAIFAEFEQVGVCRAVLSVGGRVNDGVHDTGGPRQDRRDDVQPRVRDAIVSHVHDHEGEEARQEAQEDGQHERREPGVVFFLFCCLPGQFAMDKRKLFRKQLFYI